MKLHSSVVVNQTTGSCWKYIGQMKNQEHTMYQYPSAHANTVAAEAAAAAAAAAGGLVVQSTAVAPVPHVLQTTPPAQLPTMSQHHFASASAWPTYPATCAQEDATPFLASIRQQQPIAGNFAPATSWQQQAAPAPHSTQLHNTSVMPSQAALLGSTPAFPGARPAPPMIGMGLPQQLQPTPHVFSTHTQTQAQLQMAPPISPCLQQPQRLLLPSPFGTGVLQGPQPAFPVANTFPPVLGIGPLPTMPVVSAPGLTSALQAPPVMSPALPITAPPVSLRKVKVLLTYGGTFEYCTVTANWAHTGGETRLVTVDLTQSCEQLCEQLCRATCGRVTTMEQASLRYELPSCPEVLVDVKDDADVANMTDELVEEWCRGSGGRATTPHRLHLHLYQDPCLGSCEPSFADAYGGCSSSQEQVYSVGTFKPQITAATREAAGFQEHHLPQAMCVPLSENTMEARPCSLLPPRATSPRRAHFRDVLLDSTLQGGDSLSNVVCCTPAVSTAAGAEAETMPQAAHGQQSGAHAGLPEQSSAKEVGNVHAAAGEAGATMGVPACGQGGGQDRAAQDALLCEDLTASPRHMLYSMEQLLQSVHEQVEVIQPADLQVVKFLGSGGYGDVYLAKWHGTEVAVKSLPAPDEGQEEHTKSVLWQASVLASVRHPNLVNLFAVVVQPEASASDSLEEYVSHEGVPPAKSASITKVDSTQTLTALVDAQQHALLLRQAQACTPDITPPPPAAQLPSTDLGPAAKALSPAAFHPPLPPLLQSPFLAAQRQALEEEQDRQRQPSLPDLQAPVIEHQPVAKAPAESGRGRVEDKDSDLACGPLNCPALVSEYLSGGSVRGALRRHAEFIGPTITRIKIALDAARGMEYLHSRGIISFNLKCGNLVIQFVERQPTCKVSDFALGRPHHTSTKVPSNPIVSAQPMTVVAGASVSNADHAVSATAGVSQQQQSQQAVPTSLQTDTHILHSKPAHSSHLLDAKQQDASGPRTMHSQPVPQQQPVSEPANVQQQSPPAHSAAEPVSLEPHQQALQRLGRHAAWTAPEVWLTPQHVTEKVDVYSFGVVLWCLWTRREPYEGVSFGTLVKRMATDPGLRPPLPGTSAWPYPDEPTADLCPGWQHLLVECWKGEPHQRPSFVQIVQRLQDMLTAAQAVKRAAMKKALTTP